MTNYFPFPTGTANSDKDAEANGQGAKANLTRHLRGREMTVSYVVVERPLFAPSGSCDTAARFGSNRSNGLVRTLRSPQVFVCCRARHRRFYHRGRDPETDDIRNLGTC
jgi:hypothetical protein